MLKKKFFLLLGSVLILATSLSAQRLKVIYSFGSGNSSPRAPYGSLISIDSALYGMTDTGGTSDKGTIFRINNDGTGFTVLHSFAGGPSDGSLPQGSLILGGSTFYGMTRFGGTSDLGTIFKINTNGTGFAVLHSFGGAADGAQPRASLILSGSALYGMTTAGGTSDYGTIFHINTNGTGYGLLHTFAGKPSDGRYPEGSLILSGSTLYGMTFNGGATDNGVIFQIDASGTGFALLHSFTDLTVDAAQPAGSLILVGSTLYGMTTFGGTSRCGAVFQIDTNGAGYGLLHSFAGAPSDGDDPLGSLLSIGSMLYGMTEYGGANDLGSIFGIDTQPPSARLNLIKPTEGTASTMLHSFAGAKASDGARPLDSLILSGSKLYGMTRFGGGLDWGTIFSYQLPSSDIELTKSSDNLTPWQGSEFVFTITAKNNGSDDATGLKVTDNLPTGLTYVSSTASTGSYNSSTGVWNIGSLANGATATLSVTVTAAGSGWVRNTASVSALDQSDYISSNNSASQAVTIWAPYTITTSPTGLAVTVDGTIYTAPHTIHWAPGLLHTLSVSSPQSIAAGTRYVYSSWSDGGAQAHSIIAPTNAATYTANFTTQYRLTTTANPAAGGTITPAGTNWYNNGQGVQVRARTKAGYFFVGWSGSLTGLTNPATVVMDGTKSITANFVSKILHAPVLLQPSNNATGQPASVTLKWQDTNSLPQELHYKVRIKPAGGAYNYYVLAANTTSYVKSGLAKGKTYYWSVQAIGNGTSITNSTWPADFRFRTL